MSDVSQSTDGCLVLGADAGRGNKYATRFRIDRGGQCDTLVGDIMKEECMPCLMPSKRSSCRVITDVPNYDSHISAIAIWIICIEVKKICVKVTRLCTSYKTVFHTPSPGWSP